MMLQSLENFETEMNSELHQIMALFDQVWTSLERPVPPSTIEKFSVLLHEIMSSRARTYHTSIHIIQVASGLHPLEILAALFHDCVYIQVDQRVHSNIVREIAPFELGESLYLTLPAIDSSDLILQMVCSIFGVRLGRTLTPTTGLNEFLSALVAGRMLQPFLSRWELAQVLACIEATIAFRGLDREHHTVPEQIRARLLTLIQNPLFQWERSINEEQLDEAVYHTVRVANQDVANFASKQIGYFLDSTWKLMLEGNPIFKNALFTVGQYREALERVEGFYHTLKPELIFRRYKAVPASEEWTTLCAQTLSNLKNGIEYLQVKALVLGLLEAIGDLTGGASPMVLFMGAIPHAGGTLKPFRMEQYLDLTIPVVPHSQLNPVVFHLLRDGRPGTIDFDIKNSPLAAYTYERMTPEERTESIALSKQFFREEMKASAFLKALPKNVVIAVMRAVAHIAWTRSEAVAQLERQLYSQ